MVTSSTIARRMSDMATYVIEREIRVYQNYIIHDVNSPEEAEEELQTGSIYPHEEYEIGEVYSTTKEIKERR